jgi:hypothetical protein
MKIIIFSFLTLLWSACSRTLPQQTKLMEERSPEDVAAFDLPASLNNFALQMSDFIKTGAGKSLYGVSY